MKLHEYQARELLRQADIPVPPDRLVESVQQIRQAYESLAPLSADATVVVKAQVFAGGRGKAGFVKLCDSPRSARQAAEFMLTHRMVGPQTPPEGIEVTRLLVAPAVRIAREIYLGMTVDRISNRVVLMASGEGGVEIEKLAAEKPEAILKQYLHPHLGLLPFQGRTMASELGLQGQLARSAAKIMSALAEVFIRNDCSLAEINPLALTPPDARHPQGRLFAIDAKINIDDNALFRHPHLSQLYDPAQDSDAERRARQFGLSYVSMDGRIGCLVNGAGLAMSTMDLIKLAGGEPANFLDVGGAASIEAVTEGFRLILSDERVRAVLVNIFGGIVRCDIIAEALISAARELRFDTPVVVRLEGTNVQQARQMLAEAAKYLPMLITAEDLTDAARRVVAAANGRK